MEDCIFCKIVRGEVPAEKVYENENFLAFADANPVGEGHTLVIPKKHFETILDLDEKTLEEYLKFVKKVAKILLDKHDSDGFNVVVNNGKSAGQVVPHLHFHILPRKEGDGKEGFHLG